MYMKIVISEEQLNKIVKNIREATNQRKTLNFTKFLVRKKSPIRIVRMYE